MFTVNGNPILASDMEVLQELRRQLEMQGIQRFQKIKPSGDNIMVTCPVHNNAQERKPSCGISVKTGIVHCFACSYVADLTEMISRCFGYDDNGEIGRQWLLKNFVSLSTNTRKDLIIDFSRAAVQPANYITEEELQHYRFYHPYMYKRKLTNEIIEMFDVGYDDNFELLDDEGKVKGVLKCLTFPVRDVNGNTLFIARRSVDTKIFHYPTGVNKPVYGLYEVATYAAQADEIIICESILNALTCWVYGKYAVALNGTGTAYQYRQLLSLPHRKFISGFDPDAAGFKAHENLKQALGDKKLLSKYVMPESKDLNDLTLEEFENLEEVF